LARISFRPCDAIWREIVDKSLWYLVSVH
jgi:hypothetical protein